MFTVKEKAYAKINLYLEVFSRMENGYHNIDTIMQTVSLCDDIEIKYFPCDKNEIIIFCNHPEVPTDQRNIAYKCALSYLEKVGATGRVEISMVKNVPISAGLGGGSADGAAVLRGMNRIFSQRLTLSELCKMAVTIGADIPFCVVGGAVRCQGVGDIFIPSASLSPSLHIVIAKGKQGSDTGEAYRAIDRIENRKIKEMPRKLPEALFNNDTEGVSSCLYNAFETVVLPRNKEASAIRRDLSVCGAMASLMSGSGSAVFGIFDNRNKAENAVEFLKEKGHFAVLCHPITGLTEK